MILLRVSFLAVVGLACGTFLTFPMALTVTLTGWFLCLISHFMQEAASSRLIINIYAQRSVVGPGLLDEFFRHYIRIIFSILPDFHQYNPVPLLVDGREVSYWSLGACFLFLLLLRGGVLAAAGVLIFHTRELAKLAR